MGPDPKYLDLWRPSTCGDLLMQFQVVYVGKEDIILPGSSVHFSQTLDHDYLLNDIRTNFLYSLLWTQINIVCSMLVRITLIHVNDTVVICIDIILSQPLAEIYNCMYD